MWFLLRILIAAAIAVLRHRWRNQSVDGQESWRNEVAYRRGNRRGDIQWGFDFGRPQVFELLPERRSDRWLKSLGFLVEQQTGEPGFDSRVYIRSDDSALGDALTRDAEARSAVDSLFQLGVRRIRSDGVRLWAECRSPLSSKTELLSELQVLRTRLLACLSRDIVYAPSPLSWRIAVAEILIWAIAGYAVPGLIELLRVGELAQDLPRLLAYSGTVFLIAALVLGGGMVWLLRRSSWAKKVLWEAVIVLGFALPAASATAVLDTNRLLDQSPFHSSRYQIVERRIYQRSSMGRGGRIRLIVEHVIRLRPVKPDDPAINRWLSVSRATYEDRSAQLEVTWGEGAFGFPWIESFKPTTDVAPIANK